MRTRQTSELIISIFSLGSNFGHFGSGWFERAVRIFIVRKITRLLLQISLPPEEEKTQLPRVLDNSKAIHYCLGPALVDVQ